MAKIIHGDELFEVMPFGTGPENDEPCSRVMVEDPMSSVDQDVNSLFGTEPGSSDDQEFTRRRSKGGEGSPASRIWRAKGAMSSGIANHAQLVMRYTGRANLLCLTSGYRHDGVTLSQLPAFN